MIAPQTTVTLEATGTVSGFVPWTESDVRAQLLTALGGEFVVGSVVVQSPILNNPFKWDYLATIALSAYSSYNPATLEQHVASAIQTAFTYPPTVSITKIGAQVTGASQPALDDPIVLAGNAVLDLGHGVVSEAEKAFSAARSTVTFLVIGVIVVIGLIAFSPAGKTAAGRLRV